MSLNTSCYLTHEVISARDEQGRNHAHSRPCGLCHAYMSWLKSRVYEVVQAHEYVTCMVGSHAGPEYLHHGCKPPIVYRDIKCTNILLYETFQAKLADFGLSKAFLTKSGTHISTAVAGTPGYLDPDQLVNLKLGNGDINNIVDPRLLGDFDINSAWKAVELAMACVSHTPSRRPTMNGVVMELNDCLAAERARQETNPNNITGLMPLDMESA
ncbi:putative leucine-rich repeat receptor-like protein kinase [Tanacetum coccineum]